MAAEAGEEPAALGLLERIKQVKARNRAARSIRLAIFSIVSHHQSWTPIALDDAGSDNSNHTPVPTLAVEDQAIGLALGGVTIEPLVNLFYDARLFILA